MSYLIKDLKQKVTVNTMYGVSGIDCKPGFFKSLVGRLTTDGSVVPVKRFSMALSGGTGMGEDWYIKDFCLYVQGHNAGYVGQGDKVVIKFKDKYLVYPDGLYCTVTSQLTEFNTPHFTDACVFGNRVFGVTGRTLFASALGDETRWSDYTNADGSPKETGSFTLELDSSFTAIACLLNHVALFTRDRLYFLYGSRPGNFTLTPVLNMGINVHREMCIYQNNLYFINGGKLWQFGGSKAVDLLYGLQIDVSQKNWLLADGEGVYLAGKDGIDYFDGRYTKLYEDPCTGLYRYGGKPYAKIDMDMVALQAGYHDIFYAVCTPPLNCGTTLRVIICAKGDVQILVEGKLLNREGSKTPTQREVFVQVLPGYMPEVTLIGDHNSTLYGIVFEAHGGEYHAAFTQ